jgi:hypothetical protein
MTTILRDCEWPIHRTCWIPYQYLRSEAPSQISIRVSPYARAEHIRQDGRTIYILANRNVDAIVQQARSLPGAVVEQYPVTLKEMFLEHVRSN